MGIRPFVGEDMQIGDLVRCMTWPDNPVGLVMEKHRSFLIVLVSGVTSAAFGPHQLEKICK